MPETEFPPPIFACTFLGFLPDRQQVHWLPRSASLHSPPCAHFLTSDDPLHLVLHHILYLPCIHQALACQKGILPATLHQSPAGKSSLLSVCKKGRFWASIQSCESILYLHPEHFNFTLILRPILF